MNRKALGTLKLRMHETDIDLVIYDEVDSTNDGLRRLLNAASQGEDGSRQKHASGDTLKEAGESSSWVAGESQRQMTEEGPSSATREGSNRPEKGCLNQSAAEEPCLTEAGGEPQKTNREAPVLSGTVKSVMATRQTKGRGRLGRSWASPVGGLYFSLALDTTGAAQGESALSLIVALAIRRALAEVQTEQMRKDDAVTHGALSEVPSIQVKWPNDIKCTRGKLVGILVESVRLMPGGQTAIVGMGINVNRPAADASEVAACLSDLVGRELDTLKIAQKALESILAYYYRWMDAGYSFAPFAEEYNSHLFQRGLVATVRNSNAEIVANGVVQGVDDSGCLLLTEPGSGLLRRVSGGEVTLRDPIPEQSGDSTGG